MSSLEAVEVSAMDPREESAARADGRLSRKTFVRRVAGWGLAASGIGGLLEASRSTALGARTASTTVNVLLFHPISDNVAGVINAFEKIHPDIKINLQVSTTGDVSAAAAVRLGAKDSTLDIVPVDAPLVAHYGVRGWLVPLDRYFGPREGQVWWTEPNKGIGIYKGRRLAAPVEDSSCLMYLNLDLFRSAGVAPPPGLRRGTVAEAVHGRWTFERVFAAAKRIKAKTGKTGFQIEARDYAYMMLPLGESLRGKSISPNGLKTAGFLDTPPWLKAARWYQDTYKAGISRRGYPPWSNQPFLNGEVAMFLGGVWELPNVHKARFEYDLAPWPYFAGGRPVTPNGSWHMGVSAYSRRKDAAAKFVKFWSSPAGQDIYAKTALTYGDVPPTVQGLNRIRTDPTFTKFPRVGYRLAAYEAANTAIARPRTPGFAEYDQIFLESWGDIRNGANPAKTLSSMVMRIDAELKKYA